MVAVVTGLIVMWFVCLAGAVVLLILTSRLWWVRRGQDLGPPTRAQLVFPAAAFGLLVAPVLVVNIIL